MPRIFRCLRGNLKRLSRCKRNPKSTAGGNNNTTFDEKIVSFHLVIDTDLAKLLFDDPNFCKNELVAKNCTVDGFEVIHSTIDPGTDCPGTTRISIIQHIIPSEEIKNKTKPHKEHGFKKFVAENMLIPYLVHGAKHRVKDRYETICAVEFDPVPTDEINEVLTKRLIELYFDEAKSEKLEHDDLILQVSYEPVFLLDIIDKCLPYLSGKSVEVKLDQQSVKLFNSPFGKSKFIFPLKYESFFEFLEQKYNVCIDYSCSKRDKLTIFGENSVYCNGLPIDLQKLQFYEFDLPDITQLNKELSDDLWKIKTPEIYNNNWKTPLNPKHSELLRSLNNVVKSYIKEFITVGVRNASQLSNSVKIGIFTSESSSQLENTWFLEEIITSVFKNRANLVEEYKLMLEEDCVICWENPASNLYLPCGHRAICDRCIETGLVGENCMLCRAKIENSIAYPRPDLDQDTIGVELTEIVQSGIDLADKFMNFFEDFDAGKEFTSESMKTLFRTIQSSDDAPDDNDDILNVQNMQSLAHFADPQIKSIFNEWKKTQFRMHTETEGMVKINNEQGKYKGQAKVDETLSPINNSNKVAHGIGTKLFKSNAVHYGNWVDGKAHGNGIRYWTPNTNQPGGYLIGKWEHDKWLYGGYHWTNDSLYIGRFDEYKRSGVGLFKYGLGDLYIGYWKDDKKDGYGTYKYKNGALYEGKWTKNLKSGQGKMTYANLDIFQGNWKINKKEGYGRYQYHSGNLYLGYWKSDKKSGKGRFIYAHGDIYDGNWNNNHREAAGVYRYSTGDIYEGYWYDDKKHGTGTYWYSGDKAGECYIGQWVHGKKTNGTYIYSNGEFYKGNFKDNKADGVRLKPTKINSAPKIPGKPRIAENWLGQETFEELKKNNQLEDDRFEVFPIPRY